MRACYGRWDCLNTTTNHSCRSSVLKLGRSVSARAPVEVVRIPVFPRMHSDGLGGTVSLRTGVRSRSSSCQPENQCGHAAGHSSYGPSVRWEFVRRRSQGPLFPPRLQFSARHFNDLNGGIARARFLFGVQRRWIVSCASADTWDEARCCFVYQGSRQYDGLRSERSQPQDLYLLTERRAI